MKLTPSMAAMAALLLCLLGGAGMPALARTLNIVAVNFPPYDFTREIAGEKARIVMLLPPGVESHSFEPSPRDILKIQACDIFLHTGGASEKWVDTILSSMNTDSMRIIKMMDCVQVVEEETVEGMEAEDDAAAGPEYDEHVWTAPKNAALIVRALADALAAADAENAAHYQDRAAVYLEKLTALDAEFRAVVDGAARKTLVFADRFPFRYLTEAYGLSYYAAFPGCSTETEASAATVAFLINKIKAEHIPVLFFTEFSNEKMADAICEDTRAKKRLLHACHNISRDDFKNGASYLSLMRQNARNLKEALW